MHTKVHKLVQQYYGTTKRTKLHRLPTCTHRHTRPALQDSQKHNHPECLHVHIGIHTYILKTTITSQAKVQNKGSSFSQKHMLVEDLFNSQNTPLETCGYNLAEISNNIKGSEPLNMTQGLDTVSKFIIWGIFRMVQLRANDG